MQIAIVQNNQVVKIGDYKQLFPNISFPSTGPSAQWMSENGVLGVTVFKSHTEQQKLVRCEPYVENGQVFTVTVENKTEEELTAELNVKAEKIRSQRNQLLSQTDWRFRSDLVPSQDWKDYCQALRDITDQVGFPNDVEWPEQPQEWTEPPQS